MASVRLERLSKHFGDVTAVKDLNLDIKDGEMISLLGPSGCGKTTVLLMIAGIYKPTGGNIYFDGVFVNDVSPKNRYVGLVFQSYALYPHMTVYENIAFPLRLRKTKSDEIHKKVEQVVKLTRIEELLDRKPGQLSGGQQQRVALCRALVKEPELLLLDEPLSNLDARLRIETRAELKRLQKKLGITTILVTHDQAEAMTMCDRVAVLDQGKLQQFTTPEELYDKPRDLFVAAFVGDPPMNLIDVQYRPEEPCLRSEHFSLSIMPGVSTAIERNSSSRQLVLGVRPDDIELSREKKAGGFKGKVYVTEPLGAGVLVSFRFGDLTVRALAPHGFRTAMGDELWITPRLDKIHLFEKESRSSLLYAD